MPKKTKSASNTLAQIKSTGGFSYVKLPSPESPVPAPTLQIQTSNPPVQPLKSDISSRITSVEELCAPESEADQSSACCCLPFFSRNRKKVTTVPVGEQSIFQPK
jgi:hypothetical protein